MKKKILSGMLALGVMLFGTSLSTSAATWDLYGTSSSCSSCGHVISKGTISLVGTSYKFYGYGSTVWKGGYGGKVTSYVKVRTNVGYSVGNNGSNTHEDTTTATGLNQVLASTGYFTDYFSAFYALSATVSVTGKMSSADFSYSLTGKGDAGMS